MLEFMVRGSDKRKGGTFDRWKKGDFPGGHQAIAERFFFETGDFSEPTTAIHGEDNHRTDS